jgi:hypothetical protein
MKLFTIALGLVILTVGGTQLAQADSYANNTLPIFEQKCKQELGIPHDRPLGMGFLQCINTLKILASHTLTTGK